MRSFFLSLTKILFVTNNTNIVNYINFSFRQPSVLDSGDEGQKQRLYDYTILTLDFSLIVYVEIKNIFMYTVYGIVQCTPFV